MAVKAVTITGGGANHTAVTRFSGFSVREDAAAVATVRFREGAVGGQILFELTLAASESASIIFPTYITSEDGVYVEEVAGSIEGVLFQNA